MAKVTLYSDCLSPFSYFAFATLSRYAEQKLWPIELTLKPILLGGVMAATGNMPPGARKWSGSTAKVSAQDLPRNRGLFNLPDMLQGPSNFFGPDGPSDKRGLARDMRYQRMLTAVRLHQPAALLGATRRTFELIWASVRDRDGRGNVQISSAVLLRIATEALAEQGIDASEAEKIVSAIDADDTKALLKDTTAEAVSLGAYGAPFICVEREGEEAQVFFGSDRFEQLAFTMGWPWHGPDPARPTRSAL
jgi:glutathione S-transferase kappa 1